MRCICHSAHLCASHACEKLPRTAEELLRDVYNYFCHSSKRQAEFRAFQSFAEVEPHKLLHPCQTHWLSLHACVSRVIEQWDVLIQYFKAVVDQDNLLVSQKILNHLQNPIWTIFLILCSLSSLSLISCSRVLKPRFTVSIMVSRLYIGIF